MRGIICFGLTAGQFYHRDMYIEPYSGDLDLNPEFYYSVRVPGRGVETERERVLCQTVPPGLVSPGEAVSLWWQEPGRRQGEWAV